MMMQIKKKHIFECLVFILIYPCSLYAGEGFPDFQLKGLVDLRIINTDDTTGWQERGLGKAAYGGTGSKRRTIGRLSEASVSLFSRFNWDYSGKLVLKYDPEQKNEIDILEAFVSYKPVPKSLFRFKSRIGAFFPPVSMENSSTAWTTPYTITPSAINTWIGEEVRTLGAEVTLEKIVEDEKVSITGALYKANDPAGSLLAYRGWAMHDRRPGLNDRVPLAPITSIQPGNIFAAQEPWVQPFEEIDGRWGYYIATRWKHKDFLDLNGLFYDNRANPAAFDGSQYAWHTRFINIGAKIDLDNHFKILSQYMVGNSRMGVALGKNPVDIDFSSFYILLSKKLDRHRFTIRYDNFDIDDADRGFIDPFGLNDESGDAWTIAYSFNIKKSHTLMVEVLNIDSSHLTRPQIGSASDISETLFQVNYRFNFRKQILSNI